MNASSICASKKPSIEKLLLYRFRAYVTPVIIVFGIIGNMLVIVAFSRMQKKCACRFNLYAIAIAVAHSLELVFNAFLDDFLGRGLYWLSDCTLYIKVDILSESMCKFISYVPKVAALISTNLLTVFSIDRVLTVYHPLKFRGDHHLTGAGFAITSVVLFSIILYLPLPIQSGIILDTTKPEVMSKQCQYVDPLHIGTQYTLYVHIFGSYIIPFTFVFITNVLIFLKLRDLFRERTRMSNTMERSSAESRRVLGHLCMTTTFSVIMIPIIVVIVLRQHADFHNFAELYPVYEERLVQLSKLFSSIESTYFVTEFPTFIIFLPLFRSELRKMFTCSCQKSTYRSATGSLVKFTQQRMRSLISSTQNSRTLSTHESLIQSTKKDEREQKYTDTQDVHLKNIHPQ